MTDLPELASPDRCARRELRMRLVWKGSLEPVALADIVQKAMNRTGGCQ